MAVRTSLCCMVLLLVAGTAAPVVAQRTPRQELNPFPRTLPGQVRRVVFLPRDANEDALKVGIVVGRVLMVDCNRHVFGSHMETRTVQGWGYDYHVITQVGTPASTRMACPDHTQTRQFVASSDEPMVRYNSRLPLVIFAPPDVEVRYRVWRAGKATMAVAR